MQDERETLVLLPGMMCDARIFEPQIEDLGRTHDIVSRPLTGEDSLDALANDVLASVQAERFNLAGLSMGGIVAMAVAGLAPKRVRRLALIDTNHLPDTAERRSARREQIQAVHEGHLRRIIVDEMKPHYLAAANRSHSTLLELLVGMALDLGPETFVSQSLALLARADQTASLQTYPGPTLVLCGEEDALCPPARHRDIARLPANAELVIVPGAGHIATLEQPHAVNDALHTWLARPA